MVEVELFLVEAELFLVEVELIGRSLVVWLRLSCFW